MAPGEDSSDGVEQMDLVQSARDETMLAGKTRR